MKTISELRSVQIADSVETTVTTVAGDVVIVGKVTDETLTRPAQRITIGQYPANNRAWVRAMRLTSDALMCIRTGSTTVAIYLEALANVFAAMEEDLTWTPPVINTQPASAAVVFGGGRHVHFIVVAGSELLPLTYTWHEGDNGTYSEGHDTVLTTAGIYNVAAPGTLTITPTDASKTGYRYRCVVTDSAAEPGSVNSSSAVLTVTAA